MKNLFLILLCLNSFFISCGNETKSNGSERKNNVTKNETAMSEEYEQYINNSLSTGETPYVDVYGNNYVCPKSQCSGIEVTAPEESDVIVIIKHNNKDGKVVQHGYISAGEKFRFDIPNGTYQVFFYYGRGWCPDKDMDNGVVGGFVTDEVFAKDEPQDIYDGILSYVLQLSRDGNFQTRQSDISEIF